MSETPFQPDSFQETNWPDLQLMADRGFCPCCGEKYSESSPMDIAPKCHAGSPVIVSYWDGTMYVKCATCELPVIKFKISRDLLAGGPVEHKPSVS